MKISDYIDTYHEFTALTSTVARQLVFSGIALIWIFKSSKGGDYTLSIDLYYPMLVFIIALALDLFQYLSASIIWYLFYRYHENKRESIEDDPDFEAPLIFTYFLNGVFILKITSVIVGYYYLIKYAYLGIAFVWGVNIFSEHNYPSVAYQSAHYSTYSNTSKDTSFDNHYKS